MDGAVFGAGVHRGTSCVWSKSSTFSGEGMRRRRGNRLGDRGQAPKRFAMIKSSKKKSGHTKRHSMRMGPQFRFQDAWQRVKAAAQFPALTDQLPWKWTAKRELNPTLCLSQSQACQFRPRSHTIAAQPATLAVLRRSLERFSIGDFFTTSTSG